MPDGLEASLYYLERIGRWAPDVAVTRDQPVSPAIRRSTKLASATSRDSVHRCAVLHNAVPRHSTQCLTGFNPRRALRRNLTRCKSAPRDASLRNSMHLGST